MIQKLRIENEKALRDVQLELTPVPVFIGPNDSGKTSILEAVAALCRSTDHPLKEAFSGSWSGLSLVSHGAVKPVITLASDGDARESHWHYRLDCLFRDKEHDVVIQDEYAEIDSNPYHPNSTNYDATALKRDLNTSNDVERELGKIKPLLRDQLSGVQFYRSIPRILSLPVAPDSLRQF